MDNNANNFNKNHIRYLYIATQKVAGKFKQESEYYNFVKVFTKD